MEVSQETTTSLEANGTGEWLRAVSVSSVAVWE